MSDAELLGNQIREIFEAETGVIGGTLHSKLRSLIALASAPQASQPPQGAEWATFDEFAKARGIDPGRTFDEYAEVWHEARK